MRKIFISYNSTATKNRKEEEMEVWLYRNYRNVLIVGEDAYNRFCSTISEKVASLDAKYPRTKPLVFHFSGFNDKYIFISIGEFAHYSCYIIEKEID